jgi:hypothetical protein
MKRAAACLLFVVMARSSALAGQVYGTIFQDNKPVRNTPAVLTCGTDSTSGSTDEEGVYRLFVRATGACTLVLDPNGRHASGSLYSYDRPTANDFDLIRTQTGWALRKR